MRIAHSVIFIFHKNSVKAVREASVTNSAVTLRCFDIHVKTARRAATKRYKRYKRYTFLSKVLTLQTVSEASVTHFRVRVLTLQTVSGAMRYTF